MKHYAIVAGLIGTFILGTFFIVEALGLPLLTDPSEDIRHGGVLAAVIGAGLLLADTFIPVPSSLVMIAHGTAFGVVGGFLLSLVASVGGALLGWGIGRQGSDWLEQAVSPREQRAAERFIARYGFVAIILSRMLPILAETVAIVAGATRFGWNRFLFATTLGTVPPALVYAFAGARATDFATGAAVTIGVALVAGLGWLISRRVLKNADKNTL